MCKENSFDFALSREGVITTTGRKMVQFPLSPCLSRVVLASLELNCVESVLIIAAMLSVEDVFLRPRGRQKFSKASKVWAELAIMAGGCNDFLTLLYVFEECFERCVWFYCFYTRCSDIVVI